MESKEYKNAKAAITNDHKHSKLVFQEADIPIILSV